MNAHIQSYFLKHATISNSFNEIEENMEHSIQELY